MSVPRETPDDVALRHLVALSHAVDDARAVALLSGEKTQAKAYLRQIEEAIHRG